MRARQGFAAAAMVLAAGVVGAVAAEPAYAAGGAVTVGIGGKCLDADLNTIGGNGTKVQLWDCNGQPQQQWQSGPGNTIVNVKSRRCLDADLNTIGGNGAKVQLWDCNRQSQQTWAIERGWGIVSGHNVRCLDADLNAIRNNGAKVQLWDCNGQGQQRWNGLDTSGFQRACSSQYTNDQVWQTSTLWARVAERPCVEYNAAVVRPVGQFRIDSPVFSNCSLGVGLPRSVTASCPSKAFTKGTKIRFNSAQVRTSISGQGHFRDVGCSWGAFDPGTWQSGEFVATCGGGSNYVPRRNAATYRVRIHDTGGDVRDDGDALKLLNAVEWTVQP